nr:T9SS type A sorting domain-containing protein [uncultured Psychroserpens sp.]
MNINKKRPLFFLLVLATLGITKVQAQPNIPFVILSESNNPTAIEDGIACINNASNIYNDNAFYRFYDLEDYINDGTIESNSFLLTNLEFAQSSAADNTMLTYFVGTIPRSDYYLMGSADYNTRINLNSLTILKSGNYFCKSSDNGALINIPIDPLIVDTDQVIYYSIQVASGDLDTHYFFMGGNLYGQHAYAYFNSIATCDTDVLSDFNVNEIKSIETPTRIIMNIIGISNPTAVGPPPNDTCENAQTLTVGTSFEDNRLDFTTLNATQDGGGCNTGNAMPVSNEVWMQNVIPAEGHLVVETAPDVATGNTSFVSGMDAWSGSCGNLTYLNCGSQSFSTHDFSSIVINGTPGDTVYIRVFGNFVVPFSVSAYNPPEPSNVNCENAQALTVGATFEDEAVESSFLWSQGDELWYTFVAPSDGNITIETGPDSRGNFTANTSIAVWSGMCEGFNLMPIANDLNGADTYNFSKLDLTGLIPGDTYFITIADWFQALRSPFSVSVYNTTLNTEDSVFDGFNYFPNPVNHSLTLNSVKHINQIIMYSILGQEVLNLEYKNEVKIEKIDMSRIPKGVYMLKVLIENQTKTIKIIKE